MPKIQKNSINSVKNGIIRVVVGKSSKSAGKYKLDLTIRYNSIVIIKNTVNIQSNV